MPFDSNLIFDEIIKCFCRNLTAKKFKNWSAFAQLQQRVGKVVRLEVVAEGMSNATMNNSLYSKPICCSWKDVGFAHAV